MWSGDDKFGGIASPFRFDEWKLLAIGDDVAAFCSFMRPTEAGGVLVSEFFCDKGIGSGVGSLWLGAEDIALEEVSR